MATIRYAVIVSDKAGIRVGHLYQHGADAERCAAEYAAQLGRPARAVGLEPALPVSRRADVWGALDTENQCLRIYPCREAAELSEHALLEEPIRLGMPTQCGVPRFAPAAARRTPAAG